MCIHFGDDLGKEFKIVKPYFDSCLLTFIVLSLTYRKREAEQFSMQGAQQI